MLERAAGAFQQKHGLAGIKKTRQSAADLFSVRGNLLLRGGLCTTKLMAEAKPPERISVSRIVCIGSKLRSGALATLLCRVAEFAA